MLWKGYFEDIEKFSSYFNIGGGRGWKCFVWKYFGHDCENKSGMRLFILKLNFTVFFLLELLEFLLNNQKQFLLSPTCLLLAKNSLSSLF